MERKERTHASILESAARLIRERGIEGSSVADVMKGAGLTVGGFYAHFASKEALVDEALRGMMARFNALLVDGVEGTSEPLQTVLRRYLSRSHRDHPEEGCPLPSVVSSLSTGSSPHADVVAAEIEQMAQKLEELHPEPPHPKRHRALGMFALMVGALSLARALKGTPLSDEILIAARAYARAALNGQGR